MKKLKSKIISDGEFNYISFEWDKDGTCKIAVATNDGKAFKARGKLEKEKLIILDDEEIEWEFRGGKS